MAQLSIFIARQEYINGFVAMKSYQQDILIIAEFWLAWNRSGVVKFNRVKRLSDSLPAEVHQFIYLIFVDSCRVHSGL